MSALMLGLTRGIAGGLGGIGTTIGATNIINIFSNSSKVDLKTLLFYNIKWHKICPNSREIRYKLIYIPTYSNRYSLKE